MENSKIKKLIQMLEETKVKEFELQEGDTRIKLVFGDKDCASKEESQVKSVVKDVKEDKSVEKSISQEDGNEETDLYKVESPIVGNYYSGPSPDAEPFVHVGSYVKKGDILCIVEAMKFMNEIEAPVSGTIEKILLSDGQVVEFGELLFLIKQH